MTKRRLDGAFVHVRSAGVEMFGGSEDEQGTGGFCGARFCGEREAGADPRGARPGFGSTSAFSGTVGAAQPQGEPAAGDGQGQGQEQQKGFSFGATNVQFSFGITSGVQRSVPFGAIHGVPEGFANTHPLLTGGVRRRVGDYAPKQRFHIVQYPAARPDEERDLFRMAAEGDDQLEAELREASVEELVEKRATGGLLHAAIAGAYPHAIEAVVAVLPEAGLAVTDAKGGTGLHAAAANACYPAVHYLLQRMDESALLATNVDGYNPLHLALNAFRERVDQGNGIWRVLFDATPVEGRMAVTKEGRNLLHTIAASQLYAAFPVSLFTDLPEEAMLVQDLQGLTPLHYAFAKADHSSLITVLKHTPQAVYSLECPIERDLLSWALCRSAERGLGDAFLTNTVTEGAIAAEALERTTFDRSPLLMALEGSCSHEAFILLAKAAPMPMLVEREDDSQEQLPPLLKIFKGYHHDEDATFAMLQALVPRLSDEQLCVVATASGDTVLHAAARQCSLRIAEFLCSAVPKSLFSVVNSHGDTPVSCAVGASNDPSMALFFIKHAPSLGLAEQQRMAKKLSQMMSCKTRLLYVEELPSGFLGDIPCEVWAQQEVGGPLHAIAQAPCQQREECEDCDKSIGILCSILGERIGSMKTAMNQLLPHYAAECCAPRLLAKVLPLLPQEVVNATFDGMTLLEIAARSGEEEVVKVVAAHVSPDMRTVATSNGSSLVELFQARAGHLGSAQVRAALQPSVKSAFS